MITLGLPGTGLSYREQFGGGTRRRRSSASDQEPAHMRLAGVIGFIVLCVLYFLYKHGGL
jgi:hypothetical protein